MQFFINIQANGPIPAKSYADISDEWNRFKSCPLDHTSRQCLPRNFTPIKKITQHFLAFDLEIAIQIFDYHLLESVHKQQPEPFVPCPAINTLNLQTYYVFLIHLRLSFFLIFLYFMQFNFYFYLCSSIFTHFHCQQKSFH